MGYREAHIPNLDLDAVNGIHTQHVVVHVATAPGGLKGRWLERFGVPEKWRRSEGAEIDGWPGGVAGGEW